MSERFVFIAHKSEDKARIRPIIEALLAAGFVIWIDSPDRFDPALSHRNLHRLPPGDFYPLAIPKYIQESGCVLVIWSQDSAASRDVVTEAYSAYDLGKLVPIRIDPTPPPYVFARLQTPDVSEALRARSLECDSGFRGVVEELRRKIEAPRTAAEQYPTGMVSLGTHRVAFVPAGMRDPLRWVNVKVERDASPYKLPPEFEDTPVQVAEDRTCCRLAHWSHVEGTLELTFSPVRYSDYLKSSAWLDTPLPGGGEQTHRDRFAAEFPRPDEDLRKLKLPNICGVGVFVLTHDGCILITRHSAKSHVYPERWTFSASGVMRWGASPHPFTEVFAKCGQEIGHQVDLSKLELVELGVDANKLFFEFCFVERTEINSDELKSNIKSDHEILRLGSLMEIAENLSTRHWEPAAEATLLALAVQRHGKERVAHALEKFRHQRRRYQMLDEWDSRASRPGNLAVMSVRYPKDKLESRSDAYVRGVIEFMGDDIKGKRVLEVGSGIGRITRDLAEVCAHVTGVDLCERMNQRNRAGLGENKRKVRLETRFIQGYETKKKFDAAICSLVLVHNVEPDDLDAAVAAMCGCADTVFVFEDTTQGRATGPHTCLLSEATLAEAFGRHSFAVERTAKFDLFGDDIAFLKFARRASAKGA